MASVKYGEILKGIFTRDVVQVRARDEGVSGGKY
jgi:hypothetical protein